MGNIVENKRSPRIGILGPSTYPNDYDQTSNGPASAFNSHMSNNL